MRYLKLTFLIVATFMCQTCNCQSFDDEGLNSFDLSINDEHVFFSYYKNGVGSLYSSNLDGSNIKIVFKKDNISYLNPKCSVANKKILFLQNNRGNLYSTLCMSDYDGKNLEKLTDNNSIITEATFSNDGKIIYYCKANVYESYSPIGVKDAHDFDIYSLNIKSKKNERITNLNSYGLNHLSCIQDSLLLYKIEGGPNGGIFLYNLTDKKVKRLMPTNKGNSERDFSYYATPSYISISKSIIYDKSYQIYAIDLNTMFEKLVYSNLGKGQILNICPFKSIDRLMFNTSTDKNVVYYINRDGLDLKTVNLNVDYLK